MKKCVIIFLLLLCSFFAGSGQLFAAATWVKGGIVTYTSSVDKIASPLCFVHCHTSVGWEKAFGYIGIIILLLCVIAFGTLFYLYRKKYQEIQAANIKLKEEKAALDVRLKEQEERRLRQEIIIANIQLSYKNQLLDDYLRDASVNKAKVERILNMDLRIDSNFEDFKRRLKHIHPEFYNRLQIRAKPKLTALEMKYCVCMYMNMSTRDIANMLHTDVDAVRMGKYRMKQKLGLVADDDLGTFIREVI